MASKRPNLLEDFENSGRSLLCLTGEKVNKARQACNEDRSNMINNAGSILGLSCVTWHCYLNQRLKHQADICNLCAQSAE
jgi:hypothetical protein